MSIPLCGDCPEAFAIIATKVDVILSILDSTGFNIDEDTATILGIDQHERIEQELKHIKEIAT